MRTVTVLTRITSNSVFDYQAKLAALWHSWKLSELKHCYVSLFKIDDALAQNLNFMKNLETLIAENPRLRYDFQTFLDVSLQRKIGRLVLSQNHITLLDPVDEILTGSYIFLASGISHAEAQSSYRHSEENVFIFLKDQLSDLTNVLMILLGPYCLRSLDYDIQVEIGQASFTCSYTSRVSDEYPVGKGGQWGFDGTFFQDRPLASYGCTPFAQKMFAKAISSHDADIQIALLSAVFDSIAGQKEDERQKYVTRLGLNSSNLARDIKMLSTIRANLLHHGKAVSAGGPVQRLIEILHLIGERDGPTRQAHMVRYDSRNDQPIGPMTLM